MPGFNPLQRSNSVAGDESPGTAFAFCLSSLPAPGCLAVASSCVATAGGCLKREGLQFRRPERRGRHPGEFPRRGRIAARFLLQHPQPGSDRCPAQIPSQPRLARVLRHQGRADLVIDERCKGTPLISAVVAAVLVAKSDRTCAHSSSRDAGMASLSGTSFAAASRNAPSDFPTAASSAAKLSVSRAVCAD